MSVGIIGGADGPTSVFVAGSVNIGFWLAAGCAVLVSAGIWLYCRRKEK